MNPKNSQIVADANKILANARELVKSSELPIVDECSCLLALYKDVAAIVLEVKGRDKDFTLEMAAQKLAKMSAEQSGGVVPAAALAPAPSVAQSIVEFGEDGSSNARVLML